MNNNQNIVATSSSSAVSAVTSHTPSRYYGRNEVIIKGTPIHKQTVEDILALAEDIKKTILTTKSGVIPGGTNHKEQWHDLHLALESLTEQLMNDEFLIERYRIEIINEVAIPYINEMKSPRFTLDKARFDQVKHLLNLLSHNFSVVNFNANGGRGGGVITTSPMVHPANLLYSIDRLIDNINSQRTLFQLWKSKLSTLLQSCSNKQWQPILLDTQAGLRSVGGNLICLGMVEVVGRPVVMLYPIYLVVLEALKITNEIEERGRVSPDIIVRVVKIICLLLDIVVLLIGGVAVVLASSDELTKSIAPVVAPHLTNVDMLFNRLQQIESVTMHTLNKTTAPFGISSHHSQQAVSHNSSNNVTYQQQQEYQQKHIIDSNANMDSTPSHNSSSSQHAPQQQPSSSPQPQRGNIISEIFTSTFQSSSSSSTGSKSKSD